MEDKKQEKNQDVLELIENSLGGVFGGAIQREMTNVDNYSHFGNKGTQDINPSWERWQKEKHKWSKER